jgi:phosphonate transport system substrate-binding protein
VLRLASFLAANARPLHAGIATYLAAALEEPAELLTGIAWDEQHRRLDAGEIDVAFICGLLYMQKRAAGRPLELLCAPVMAAPRYGSAPIYFTDVVVRADRPFRTFADLRGAVFAYNEPESHSGYNVIRHHLLTLGETRGYFGAVVASGSHQRSIDLVLAGRADATGVDSTVLELEAARRPEIAAALRPVAAIGPGPIPPVIVARGLAPALRARLAAAFLGMAGDPAGRPILARGGVARFVRVAEADYAPLLAMVDRARAAGFSTLR